MTTPQVMFEDDCTDDPVAAEEFVDEGDYFQFLQGFRGQVGRQSISLLEAHPVSCVAVSLFVFRAVFWR